jgi:hypothetical protein
MMSLWIGASSGNLFGNIGLRGRSRSNGVLECRPARIATRSVAGGSIGFCFAVLATDYKVADLIVLYREVVERAYRAWE